MTIHQDNQWDGENMNFAKASQLTKEFFADPRVSKKVKFGAATWLGRILSLGYNIEEIYNMIKNPTLSRSAINMQLAIKSNERKKLYYEELMKI